MAAKRDPIGQWREDYARCMLQLDFEPASDAPFHVSTEPIVEGIRIARSSFSPGFTIRDEELVKNSDDSFALLISRSKQINVMKWRHFQLGHGDGCLMRTSDPGTLGSTERFSYVAMMIPFAEMQKRLPNADGLIAERLSKKCEGLQLLKSYIRALETGRRAMSVQARATVQRHLFDLAALAVESQSRLSESSLSAVAAARLSAAHTMIEARFEDPDISIATVASALAISPRYLQRLFGLSETSFTECVNNLRLGRAHTLLTGAHGDTSRISNIALQVGFSDVSYFDRTFKRRYGASPSEIRAQACAKRR